MWLAPQTLSAAERPHNVLFIHSYNKHTPWYDLLRESLAKGFAEKGVKVNIITEYLNADYWRFESEQFIMRRICERARQRGTDLIVTSGDEAFFTLTHCGDSLPYQLPVVVSGIQYPDEELFRRMPNVSGYVLRTDFDLLLKEAVRMFPSRKNLVCLADSSTLSQKGVAAVEEAWDRIKNRYPDHELRTLNVQTRSMNSIITTVCYDYNAYRYVVIAPKWIPFLSLKLKAPVFASQNQAMTNGVLCVYDTPPGKDLLAAGHQAAAILKGTAPAEFGIEDFSGELLYDYKQLQFFRADPALAESRGRILNISWLERYYGWFLLFNSIVLASLVLLVVWLFRIKRRESRRRIHAQTRLLVQNRLVEQRNEFDNIFCSIRDGLITYGLDYRIHFANRPLIRMLGLSPETYPAHLYEGQMAGTIFKIYINGRNVLRDLLENVCIEKKSFPIPPNAFMQENRYGAYFPISGEVVPIFANEKMTGMAIVCRNISDEEMQKRFFNMAVEESAVYPWQYDMRLNRFRFTGGLLRRFNYTDARELFSRDEMEAFIHPEDLPHTSKRFDDILKGNEAYLRMNFRLKNADGKYEWWEFRSTAYDGLTGDTPYMVLGVCQSIQRYKDTEEALIAARDRALQADKLKSAFIANMSHEIRTPLNAIVGFSDLLKDINTFTSEEVQLFVKTIGTNCTLLLALINDILDLSRIESGTMEFRYDTFNLTFIMQQIYDSQCLNMPQNVELRVELPEGEGKSIVTDSVRLKQVVNNLINNAKKFTQAGSITFGYAMNSEGYTTLFVEDTGNGISPEAQKHIFERFYKVDSFTQGAGLGLSICQTIVEHLHGSISVTSEVGRGTRFEVMIPDISE